MKARELAAELLLAADLHGDLEVTLDAASYFWDVTEVCEYNGYLNICGK